jgi:amino acid transporter
MAEETEDSARSVPRTILYSTYINALLGFLLIIALMFTWGDMAEITDSTYGWRFLTIFYNTTGSKAATKAMTMLIVLPTIGSVIACVATASRQTWAFARDTDVPFSATVSRVSKTLFVCVEDSADRINAKSASPLNAIFVSLIVCVLLSFVNIAPATEGLPKIKNP